MLRNVHLRNLALIREADIDLSDGLNIMTGETGAGKSIIIGSISIALGGKASSSFIRNGADSGMVELLFTSRDSRVTDLLQQYDIPEDDGNIIISRKITPGGSISKINGETVTLARLKEITSLLVDIHGQHEHQTLLNPANHLSIIDEYAGDSLAAVKHDFHDSYMEYKKLRSQYRQFEQNPEELAKEISFLEFEIKEIEDAGLKPDEDTLLEAEYKKLSSAEKINEGLMKLQSSLSGGISESLSDALRELNYLITIEPELKSFQGPMMDLDSIARDLNHDLAHYADAHAFNAERYQKVHDRLNEINRLKSKYGNSVHEILDYQAKLSDRLSQIRDFAKGKAELTARMDAVRSQVNRLANTLSEQRKAAAALLQQLICNNLQDLNFLNVDFQISFSKADKIYENGYDKVEFMISANVGEPVKPLAKVASGGELSRIMLAIKASLADADRIDTLIFDEIDTGISGRTAQKVAEKMGTLSRSHQLICITHLPQIAAMADSHFVIEKGVSDGSTISDIRSLSDEDSAAELARLISGSEITASTLHSAAEMKAAARKHKQMR